MKNILLICLLLVLASFQSSESEWKTYIFKKSNFKMSFPEKPSVQTKEDAISIRAEKSAIVYNVLVTINNDFDLKMSASLLAESEKGIKQESDKLIKSQSSKYQKFPMKEIHLKSKDGMAIIYRTIITKSRLYQLAIAQYGNFPSDDITKKFFDSFEFLD